MGDNRIGSQPLPIPAQAPAGRSRSEGMENLVVRPPAPSEIRSPVPRPAADQNATAATLEGHIARPGAMPQAPKSSADGEVASLMKAMLQGAAKILLPGIGAKVVKNPKDCGFTGVAGSYKLPSKPTAVGGVVKVQKGDTLSGIAKRELGDASRWKEIAALNKGTLKDPNKIMAGQVLQLPPKNKVSGPVTPGKPTGGVSGPAPAGASKDMQAFAAKVQAQMPPDAKVTVEAQGNTMTFCENGVSFMKATQENGKWTVLDTNAKSPEPWLRNGDAVNKVLTANGLLKPGDAMPKKGPYGEMASKLTAAMPPGVYVQPTANGITISSKKGLEETWTQKDGAWTKTIPFLGGFRTSLDAQPVAAALGAHGIRESTASGRSGASTSHDLAAKLSREMPGNLEIRPHGDRMAIAWNGNVTGTITQKDGKWHAEAVDMGKSTAMFGKFNGDAARAQEILQKHGVIFPAR